jgi:hypothetical protein
MSLNYTGPEWDEPHTPSQKELDDLLSEGPNDSEEYVGGI